MDKYTREELEEALLIVSLTISRCVSLCPKMLLVFSCKP